MMIDYTNEVKRIKYCGYCIQVETPVSAVRVTRKQAIEYVENCGRMGKQLRFSFDCINGKRRYLVQIRHGAALQEVPA